MSRSPSSPGQRIRVLQVSHDLGVGGLPRVVETLTRVIDPTRFEVEVVCLNFVGELGEALARDGFRIHAMPRVPGRPDYFAFKRVAALLRAGRHRIVHSHNTQPFIDAGLAAVLVPGVRLIHTDHARDFPDKFKYMAMEHVLSWRAHRVVGVSEHTTENLHRYERIARRKLVTIPNGIDDRPFAQPVDRAAVRASLGVPEDAFVAVLGARLEDQKDIPTLLEAVRLALPQAPRLVLVLAGEGSLRRSLEARVDELGLRDHVRFAGVRMDMHAVLRAADCFAMSSLWEGLPMVILEAMAAGCPIVSTGVGGIPSALTDGESGLLVPPSDPAALAAALVRFASDPALRTRLAARAKGVFADRFSAGAMARRYEALYLEALGLAS